MGFLQNKPTRDVGRTQEKLISRDREPQIMTVRSNINEFYEKVWVYQNINYRFLANRSAGTKSVNYFIKDNRIATLNIKMKWNKMQ